MPHSKWQDKVRTHLAHLGAHFVSLSPEGDAIFTVLHFSKYDMNPVMRSDAAGSAAPWYSSAFSFLGRVASRARSLVSGSTGMAASATVISRDPRRKRPRSATTAAHAAAAAPSTSSGEGARVPAAAAAGPTADILAAVQAVSLAAATAAAAAAVSELQRGLDQGRQAPTQPMVQPATTSEGGALLQGRFSSMEEVISAVEAHNRAHSYADIRALKNGNQTRKTLVCVRHPDYVNHIQKQRSGYEEKRKLKLQARPARSQSQEPLRKRARKAQQPPVPLASEDCKYRVVVKLGGGSAPTDRPTYHVCEKSVFSHSCQQHAVGLERAPLSRKQIQLALKQQPGGQVRVRVHLRECARVTLASSPFV
jgi:hypothetical protein